MEIRINVGGRNTRFTDGRFYPPKMISFPKNEPPVFSCMLPESQFPTPQQGNLQSAQIARQRDSCGNHLIALATRALYGDSSSSVFVGEKNESHYRDFVSPQTNKNELEASNEIAFAPNVNVIYNYWRSLLAFSSRNTQRPRRGYLYHFSWAKSGTRTRAAEAVTIQ